MAATAPDVAGPSVSKASEAAAVPGFADQTLMGQSQGGGTPMYILSPPVET